jgi:hypothetical protein
MIELGRQASFELFFNHIDFDNRQKLFGGLLTSAFFAHRVAIFDFLLCQNFKIVQSRFDIWTYNGHWPILKISPPATRT